MLRAMDEARETLNLEYYIWEPDHVGTRDARATASPCAC